MDPADSRSRGPFIGGADDEDFPPPIPDPNPAPVASGLDRGLYLGAVAVSTAAGTTPPDAPVALPDGYAGPARLMQVIAGLTDAPNGSQSLVGFTLGGVSAADTASDPDAVGSRAVVGDQFRTDEPVTGTGHLTGATETAYVAFTVGAATGTQAMGAGFPYTGLTTGHTFFNVMGRPAEALWVECAVTLAPTPPTITDPAGFTWTLEAQEPLGDGWISVWSAPITEASETWVPVTVSQQIDSALGFLLTIPS